jgi:Transglutaminase-like superfamily
MGPRAGSTDRWGWQHLGRRAYRFFSLPAEDRRLLAEAALWLLLSRAAVAVLPFKTLARLMGRPVASASLEADPATVRAARRVAWAIQAAAFRIPIRLNCLPRSLGAKVMLRLRGVPSVLHLGARLEERGMQAHAWLMAGGMAVTGGEEAGAFRKIAAFE